MQMDNKALATAVRDNLVGYNKWNDVRIEALDGYSSESPAYFVSGCPPSRLEAEDEDNLLEWVVPNRVTSEEVLTTSQIEEWFMTLANAPICGKRPKRITIGLVNDDSTVVYYFIHDGFRKPREN